MADRQLSNPSLLTIHAASPDTALRAEGLYSLYPGAQTIGDPAARDMDQGHNIGWRKAQPGGIQRLRSCLRALPLRKVCKTNV